MQHGGHQAYASPRYASPRSASGKMVGRLSASWLFLCKGSVLGGPLRVLRGPLSGKSWQGCETSRVNLPVGGDWRCDLPHSQPVHERTGSCGSLGALSASPAQAVLALVWC